MIIAMAAAASAAQWLHRLYSSSDSLISDAVISLLNSTAGVQLTGTPPTRALPTVDSPTPLLFIIVLYLSMISFGLHWVRKFDLKPRFQEPIILQALVILHNSFCLGLSAYMCVGIARQAYLHRYTLWGNAYNENEVEMAHFIYVFYISKIVEFMDTMIMLMKRNVRQVTVLHIYHHVSISLIWWIIAHHAPGGDGYFSAAINSGIHVLMYLYYLVSAILRSDEKKRRKYLFWGKYLTQLQMLQFTLNMLQAYYCIKSHAPYPQFLCKILFYYMISLLLLFSNFYLQKYTNFLRKSRRKKLKGE